MLRNKLRLPVLLFSLLAQSPAEAGEGAFSNYFPGAYGSLLPGLAPEPGFVFANVNLLYNGKADRAVGQGRSLAPDQFDRLKTDNNWNAKGQL